LDELSTRICACITYSLHWIGTKVCDPLKYDGIIDVYPFFKEFVLKILDQQRLIALDLMMKATLARWWLHIRRA
jgi:hypothetical protein